MMPLSRREFVVLSLCALFAKTSPPAAQKGQRSREFPEKSNSVLSVAWSSDGKRIAAGGLQETIWVWNASTGALEKEIRPMCAYINSLSFSPDHQALAVGGSRETRLYDLNTGMLYDKCLDGFIGSMTWIAFSPDGARIAGTDEGGTMILFDNKGLNPVQTSEQGGSFSIGWSPDSKQIAVGDINKLRVFNVATGKLVWRWDQTPNTVKALAWSKDGTKIAVGCADNIVYLTDAVTGRKIRKFVGHDGHILSVAFAADDTRLMTASEDKTVGIWEVETGKNIAFVTVSADSVSSVAFSPDRKQCVVGGYTAHVSVYDLPL